MEILGSFFVGKAFAEVLNERLGNAAADALAEFGKMEAEIRKEIRYDGVICNSIIPIKKSSTTFGSLFAVTFKRKLWLDPDETWHRQLEPLKTPCFPQEVTRRHLLFEK
jgi:hypothetical protein